MYKSVLQRLKQAAICSNGLFVVGQLFLNQKERNSFFMLKKRHPDFFKEIFKGERSSIYSMTSTFLNYYEIDISVKNVVKREEILKNLAWLPFCLTHNLNIKTPDLSITLDEMFLVDDFGSNILKASGMKIITLPFRSMSITASNNTPIITGHKDRIWVSRTIESFVFGRPLTPIQGGFFPLTEDQCHEDLRIYPGIKDKISGKKKWDLDKVLINNSITLPPNYEIGIYH